MSISVTEFKHRCVEIIRRVERTGMSVDITRRGRVVAHLCRAGTHNADAAAKPWEQLRAAGGRLFAAPAESILTDREFEALRSKHGSPKPTGSSSA